MNTPIYDFVKKYAESSDARLHMPGHKGKSFLGFEKYDITEINGADSLYKANGIIKESEENASSLFGCRTFYSAEGSSLCIKAMVYLAVLYAKQTGKKPLIAAGRNAHKAFLSAVALTDADVTWLYPEDRKSYLSCKITAAELENSILNSDEKPVAVYLTTPDYLGNTLDIKEISLVCKKHGILLIVDNAHGAYLKFLPEPQHPIDLGADLCCDSAHKTLPVLTGGAYLHVSENAPAIFENEVRNALSLFGSTSPSYIILQSLDRANKYIADGYRENLADFIKDVSLFKKKLCNHGYILTGDEPIKITVKTKSYGYYAWKFADILEKNGFVCEFSDRDFAVMMLTPETDKDTLEKLGNFLVSLERKDEIAEKPPAFAIPQKAMSVRDAVFSPCETVPSNEAQGRILARATVACPPAVPVVISGEIIDKKTIECFEYYGITECTVVK